MRKILGCLSIATLLLTGCTSTDFRNVFDSLNTSVPEAINQAVSSRVNAENELYTVGSASVGQTGSIIAQSKANKIASEALRSKIRAAVETNFKSYTLNMDSYSKNLVLPAIPELTSYATDLVIKQVKQKGAWEDSSKVYSLLSVPTAEVTSTSQKVLKSFLTNTSKKLEDLSQGI